MMFGNDGPETPEADLIRAVIMQAYRDLLISVRADGSSSFTTQSDQDQGCCQTNENSHRIAGAALIYALNSWRHSVRAAARFS